MLVGRMVLDRIRRALPIMQKLVERAGDLDTQSVKAATQGSAGPSAGCEP
jgi:hypothetical protein